MKTDSAATKSLGPSTHADGESRSDARELRASDRELHTDIRELRTRGALRGTVDMPWSPTAPAVTLTSGDIVNGHRLGPLLARTPSGALFRAFHAKIGAVALKLLAVDDHEATRAIRARAAAWAEARVSHPNLTAVIDAGEYLLAPYVVTELVIGTPVARYVGVSIPLLQALRWLLDVARGLEAAHAAGLVHGDVRVENVVLVPAGAKLLMFGKPRTTSMAPERKGDVGSGTARSDQHEWALLACDLLLGSRPAASATPTDALPSSIARLLDRALEAAPAERFASMSEIVEALAEIILAGESHDPTLTRGQTVAPRSAPRSAPPPTSREERALAAKTPESVPPSVVAKSIPIMGAAARADADAEPERSTATPEDKRLTDALADAAYRDVRVAVVGRRLREIAIVVAVDVVGTKARFSVHVAATDERGSLHVPPASAATLAAAGAFVAGRSRTSEVARRWELRLGTDGRERGDRG